MTQNSNYLPHRTRVLAFQEGEVKQTNSYNVMWSEAFLPSKVFIVDRANVSSISLSGPTSSQEAPKFGFITF